jgi:hypothetical protein
MTKISLSECEAYIKRYEPEETQVPGYLSNKGIKIQIHILIFYDNYLIGFYNLLMAIDFDIFNRSHRLVCQDMSQPLPHYFIASSHNTYELLLLYLLKVLKVLKNLEI